MDRRDNVSLRSFHHESSLAMLQAWRALRAERPPGRISQPSQEGEDDGMRYGGQ